MRSSPCDPGARLLKGLLRVAVPGLLALAAAGCADVVASDDSDDSDDGPQEQLLFVSTRGDDRQVQWTDLDKDVYRMNADGTGVVNLTRHPATIYRSISLSPDGNRLVFNSNRSGCYDLWTMNTDGTAPRQLTFFEQMHRCNVVPRWSRDGSRIAFTTSREQNWAVYVMNADGSGPRNVSTPVEKTGGVAYPVGWAPDGRVVFQHAAGGVPVRTYVVNADGSGRTPLLPPGDYFPAWSPDGSRIAFLSSRDGNFALYVMRGDGSDVRRLSNLPGEDVFARSWGYWENEHSPWSPDGERIAFTHYEGSTTTVYVAAADGTGLLRVTPPELNAVFNGWSPSGTRIALTSNAAGAKDVYVVKADGTGLVNLTPGPGHDSDALWLPRR